MTLFTTTIEIVLFIVSHKRCHSALNESIFGLTTHTDKINGKYQIKITQGQIRYEYDSHNMVGIPT